MKPDRIMIIPGPQQIQRKLHLILSACFFFLPELTPAYSQDNIKTSPDQLFVYYAVSMKNKADKNYNNALVYLDSALAIAPFHPNLIYERARILELNGDSFQAASDLSILISQKQHYVRQMKDDSLFNGNKNYKDVLLQLDSMDHMVHRSQKYIQLQEKNLVPEGISYDPIEKALYVSSIYKRKIVKIDSLKKVTDFVPTAKEGLLSTLGMEVDPARRHLWVCSSYDPSNRIVDGDDLKPQAAIFQFELESGKLIKKFTLNDTLTHFFNDITVMDNGDVYFTDSAAGTAYVINKGDEIRPLFEENFLLSANGITKDDEGENLFISSWVRGIIKYNIGSGKWHWIESDDSSANLSGIDGMAFYKGSLIVNSPIETRGVIKFVLTANKERVSKAEFLEYGNILFGEPTTGELAGEEFYYIANSGLGAYDRATGDLDEEKLSFPEILKINLNE